MSDPFDIENDRIEILDDKGNSVVFRPMAIIGNGEKLYYVFGTVEDNEEEQQRQLRLILARREEKEDGSSRYVLCENEQDVAQIVGSYISQIVSETAKGAKKNAVKHKKLSPCKAEHEPLEFCFCGQKEYLQ